jgi:hypothetical protein
LHPAPSPLWGEGWGEGGFILTQIFVSRRDLLRLIGAALPAILGLSAIPLHLAEPQTDSPAYTLLDDFGDVRKAGQVTNTPPAPGPGGNRVVQDTANKVSVRGGGRAVQSELQPRVDRRAQPGDCRCRIANGGALRQYAQLNAAVRPAHSTNFLAIGDSKTAGPACWPALLTTADADFIESPQRIAFSGYPVAVMKAIIDAQLAASVGTPDVVLINLGANEIFWLLTQADCECNDGYIVDGVHPNAAGHALEALQWRIELGSRIFMPEVAG